MVAAVAVVVMAVAVAGTDVNDRKPARQPTDKSIVRQGKPVMKLLGALSLALLLAACGKLNVENYDKLKSGMSYEEVKRILGPPAKCSDVLGVKQCSWGDETRHVDVSFIGDQVLIFSAENIR